MKKLLIYTFCFFALLACNKEESVRLQKDEPIVNGTVSEQQRGLVIEGATVYLHEYLVPSNYDKCGTCNSIIDSTITDANGNFEFKFRAKKGTDWVYAVYCKKQNYITKIASRFNDIVKEQSNTANLALYATGGLNIYFINNSSNKKLFVEKVTIDNDYYYASGAAFGNRGAEKIDINAEDFLLKIKNIEAQKSVTFIAYITDYSLFPNQSKTYFIESNLYKNDTIYF